MKRLTLAALAAASVASGTLAQPYGAPPGAYPGGPPPGPYGLFPGDPNNTGGGRARIIARGATGADTIFDSSARGGNAARPELAVPNGSGGGGGGSR